jgi:hypothetical protein
MLGMFLSGAMLPFAWSKNCGRYFQFLASPDKNVVFVFFEILPKKLKGHFMFSSHSCTFTRMHAHACTVCCQHFALITPK